MARYLRGDKPLHQPVLTQISTCLTWPQWINGVTITGLGGLSNTVYGTMVCNSLVKPSTAPFSKSANAKSTIDCLTRIFKNKTSTMDYPKTKTFAQRDHTYGSDKRKYQRHGSFWLIKKWWIRWWQSWFCCQVSCCVLCWWSLFFVVDKQRHQRSHSKTLY